MPSVDWTVREDSSVDEPGIAFQLAEFVCLKKDRAPLGRGSFVDYAESIVRADLKALHQKYRYLKAMVEHTEAIEEGLETSNAAAQEAEELQGQVRKLEEGLAIVQGKLNDRVVEASALSKEMEREKAQRLEAKGRLARAAEELEHYKREAQDYSAQLSRSLEAREKLSKDLDAAIAEGRRASLAASESAVEAYKASDAFRSEVGLLYRDGIKKLMGLFVKEMGMKALGVDPRSFIVLKAYFAVLDREADGQGLGKAAGQSRKARPPSVRGQDDARSCKEGPGSAGGPDGEEGPGGERAEA